MAKKTVESFGGPCAARWLHHWLQLCIMVSQAVVHHLFAVVSSACQTVVVMGNRSSIDRYFAGTRYRRGSV